MSESREIIAIILAGGSGTRLTPDSPKQFNKIAGLTVVEHTFRHFDAHPSISAVRLVVPGNMNESAAAIISSIVKSAKKPIQVVQGGETRNISTLNALATISDDNAFVLVHDAARPLISDEVTDRCINALYRCSAVDTVVPCADTIVRIDDKGFIEAVPDRKMLRRGQTPQGFHISTLRSAYQAAAEHGDLQNTDDCSIILKYLPGTPIECVDGAESNIKITYPIDLVTADRLFQLRTMENSNHRILKGKTLIIFGASSGIGESIAVLGRAKGAHIIAHSPSTTGVDIRNEDHINRVLEETNQQYGRVDAVITSAGLLQKGAVSQLSVEEIKKGIETNLLGPFIVARAAVPYLTHSKGHLLFFTSSSYTRGRADYAVYSATKAGIVNMVQALSEELGDREIKVNCINPERTDTRMRSRAFPGEEKSSLLTPVDVARGALDLLQSDTTGQVVDVRRAPSK